MYSRRLVDACRTLRTIDTGDFPFEVYSSGEVSKRWVNSKGETTREEYAELPIYRDGNVKGLRHGLAHTIYHTREMFKSWGLEELADKVIVDFKKDGTE